MKIQRLTIHNMASIEDAEIDFSAKPLVDSDVFLITGKTGSGKSTILDSICLALYGTTPRLSGTRMQGAVNDAGKEVYLDDPAQILRENTGEGYVKLTFEGSDGVPYEAEWSIARARKKPSGKLQGKKWVVKNLRDGMQYSKDAEIRSVISEAVKLSFEQFCRTTMLAQGEFQKFLTAKSDERGVILGKLYDNRRHQDFQLRLKAARDLLRDQDKALVENAKAQLKIFVIPDVIGKDAGSGADAGIGENEIAVAHTYEMNGDLMYDPEMTFRIDTEEGALEPLTFRQDGGLPIYQEVYPEPGKWIPKLRNDLSAFAEQWLKNIEMQGRVRTRAIAEIDGEDVEFSFDAQGQPVRVDDVSEPVEQDAPEEVQFTEIMPNDTPADPFTDSLTQIGRAHV